MDRRTAAFARRWSPETWRYFAVIALDRDGAWFGEQGLTKEAIFALTLRVQQWLAGSPTLSKTSVVVRALQTLRREIAGQRVEAYEVLEVLRNASEEEPGERLLFVRANLRRMFGQHAKRVTDDRIAGAMVFDRAGHLEPGYTWEPVFALLSDLKVMSSTESSVRRGWRQVMVARGIRPPREQSRSKAAPDR